MDTKSLISILRACRWEIHQKRTRKEYKEYFDYQKQTNNLNKAEHHIAKAIKQLEKCEIAEDIETMERNKK